MDKAKVEKNEKTEKDEQFESFCGMGSCQPRGLQCFKNVLSFTLLYGLASLVTQTLGVYIVSQITALEKQFKMSSTITGVILSCNDIGFLSTVLFVSHFGRNRHIPRILSFATFLFGISGILASLCHFIEPFNLPKLSVDTLGNSSDKTFLAPLCVPGKEGKNDDCGDEGNTKSGGPTWPIWLLGISMILQGIGKSPRSALSTTYIDNNNSVKTKTGFFLGISMTMTLFGPALAIALGGVFRRIPLDLQDTVLTPKHPKWIGAWWIGFLLFGVLGILAALPLLFFPKHINPPEDTSSKQDNKAICENIKDLPRSVFRVFKSPVYSLSLTGLMFLFFAVGGTQSFTSKYVEKQFMVTGFKTNIILGIQSIISASIGTFAGGFLTSRLKLTRRGCLRMVLISLGGSLLLNSLDFFLGCDTPYIHGFHDIKNEVKVDDGLISCTCDTTSYFPVCGDDKATFFSPCFAGCVNQTQSIYGGCIQVTSGQVKAGMCETDCPYLYYYLVVDLIQKLIGTMSILPMYMIILRSVEETDKTIAFALLSFLGSLLGFLPAPILFGYVIDNACLIWEYSCGTKGACAQYDLRNLRYTLKSAECGGKSISLIFFILAYIVLKVQTKNDKNTEKQEKIINKKAEKTETSRL